EIAGADRLAVLVIDPLEHHLEAVTGMDFALEVDIIAERMDHLGQYGRRHMGVVGGVEQARMDRATRELDGACQRMLLGARGEMPAIAALDDEIAVERRSEAQLPQVLCGELQSDFLADLEV